MPYRPSAYSGPTFEGSTPITGYGVPSSYMYDLIQGQTSAVVDTKTVYTNHTAWKEFGIFGVSTNATTSAGNAVRENPPASGTCRPAYMAVTILPVTGFT